MAESIWDAFPLYCEQNSHQDSRTRNVLASVKFSTLDSYTSHIRHMARALNSITSDQLLLYGVQRIPPELLKCGCEDDLLLAVGRSVSRSFWSQFLGFRAEKGIRGAPAARCALLKAQELCFDKPWANATEVIKETNGAERRACWHSDDPIPVGAITESMLLELIDTISHPHKAHISLIMKAEFYGCFRLGELLNMYTEDLADDFVIIRDPKTRKAAEAGRGQPARKDLSLWEGGRLALQFLHEAAAMVVHGPICPPYWWKEAEYLDFFEQGEIVLLWDKALKYRSHGLRHGGVNHCLSDPKLKAMSSEELSKTLIMCPKTIQHYKKDNQQRIMETNAQCAVKKSELIKAGKFSGGRLLAPSNPSVWVEKQWSPSGEYYSTPLTTTQNRTDGVSNRQPDPRRAPGEYLSSRGSRKSPVVGHKEKLIHTLNLCKRLQAQLTPTQQLIQQTLAEVAARQRVADKNFGTHLII